MVIPTPFTAKDLGAALQTHIDVDTLIQLSSVSRDSFRVHRPWLMQRMVTLFDLDIDVSFDLNFEAVLQVSKRVMSALHERSRRRPTQWLFLRN